MSVAVRNRSLLVLLFLLLPACLMATTPELAVTGLYMAAGRDVDADFVQSRGGELSRQESARLVEKLREVEGWRVADDFISDPASSIQSWQEAGSRIYVRALVTRADARSTTYFGGLTLWLLSVGTRLEFFDLRSGQVHYGCSFTVRIPIEAGETLDTELRNEQFALALSRGLDECCARAARDYNPGNLNCTVVDHEAEEVILNQGRRQGLLPGQVLAASSDSGDGWMLRVTRAEEAFALAQVLASTGATGLPPQGVSASLQGINQSHAQGKAIAVAGVNPGAREALDPSFLVESATMAQWLHDALVDQSELRMLPPLAASAEGDAGSLATAFFHAQAEFSAVGDIGQEDIIGHRALPDLLIRGTITHAVNLRSQRLGFEAQTLRLGLLLEVYDRRTREVLGSVSHEVSKLEKQNERYRQVDLETAWRELALQAMRESAGLLSSQPLGDSKEFVIQRGSTPEHLLLDATAPAGGRGSVLRVLREIRDTNRNTLGHLREEIGVAGVQQDGSAKLLLSDGIHTPEAGDVLLLEHAGRDTKPLVMLGELSIGGPKVREDWAPTPALVLTWAHRELSRANCFRLLPPERLSAEAGAAEVAMAMGEFKAGNVGELILQQDPVPDLLLNLRVGLGRWVVEEDKYRNRVTFTTGVEATLVRADTGEALAWFRTSDGSNASSLKKAWSLVREQELANGQVVQGISEGEFPEQLDQCLEECLSQLLANLGDELVTQDLRK